LQHCVAFNFNLINSVDWFSLSCSVAALALGAGVASWCYASHAQGKLTPAPTRLGVMHNGLFLHGIFTAVAQFFYDLLFI
jgi:hypothetical protein